MRTKAVVLLLGFTALSGCCATGSNCATSDPNAPLAWDGRGPGPGETGSAPKARRTAARPHDTTAAPAAEPTAASDPADAPWAKPMENSDADSRLGQRLKICRNC